MFRTEALAGRGLSWLGEIVLIRPVSFSLLTFIAVILGVMVVAFFSYGSYTKRSTVAGQLVPSSGQVKIYAPQYGVVLERFVEEGQNVERGERLISLSSERSSDSGLVQANVSEKLSQRHRSLKEELAKQEQLQAEERQSLQSKLESLRQELKTLMHQLDNQKKLVALASNAAERYQGLMDKGYISMDQLQQRQAQLLGERLKLQGLMRETTALRQKRIERRHELSGLPALHENQLASIRRALSSVEQELIENEAKRSVLITAPKSGIVTSILADPGQTVNSTRSLMSLVPTDSILQAELYAPSKTIGFIRTGDAVVLRYQAYPYQKFGQQDGQVRSISRTTLSAAELGSISGSVPGIGTDGEQIYRIRVDIEKQSVNAYGDYRPLQTGMLVDADILQETRRLYEWVLEPLYTLTGKL
ncbi:HlyD family secretion protein [Pseudomonas putida]|uniref:HlyD family secretion protein n=1 Tax=Pseudomonas putida TaxID=303 RepID=A0A1Y3LIF7_PSEPU|nr:HlyD family efflux transporter periplasmic adaptor subunit [Pseudomonas putida]OUM37766.1 HlyD family secretion protein [Pseudomonas putida]